MCWALNLCQKGDALLNLIKNERIAVLCLQETHLNTFESTFLEYVVPERISHAPSVGRCCGMMLEIAKSLPWVSTQQIIDMEGHFVIFKGKLNRLRN